MSQFSIEEDLWFGDFEDQEAEARAARSIAAKAGKILGAKPFPIAAKRLEELTRNPSTRIEQVVKVLESDPGLSARLLRLVNSSGYALRVRCTSVRHAAALVGTNRLNAVATTAAILDMFSANTEVAVRLLEHAAIVGSLSRYLAVHLGLPRDELFTCGFLHDIGKLMLLDTESQDYADLLRKYEGKPDSIHSRERELLGFDHAVLGANVLSAWNIPKPVPQVVAWHHQVGRAYNAGPTIIGMVHALRLADALSYALDADLTEDPILRVAHTESALYLEVSEQQLAAMWGDLRALSERCKTRVSSDGHEIVPRRLDVPDSLSPRVAGGALSSQRAPEILQSIRPPDSIRPRTHAAAPDVSSDKPPVSEVPEHFPCCVCAGPTYASQCACCRQHVCPRHVNRRDGWCASCSGDFAIAERSFDPPLVIKLAAVMAGLCLAALCALGAATTELSPSWFILVGPIPLFSLYALVLIVGRRWYGRWSFVKERRLETHESEPLTAPEANDVVSELEVPQEPLIERAPSETEPQGVTLASPLVPQITYSVSEPSPAPTLIEGFEDDEFGRSLNPGRILSVRPQQSPDGKAEVSLETTEPSSSTARLFG